MSFYFLHGKKSLCSLAGFTAGLLLVFFMYILIFHVSDIPFTYKMLVELHSRDPLLFIADLIPLILGFAGHLADLSITDHNAALEKRIQNDQLRIEEAITLAEKLTKGDFSENNIKISEDELLLSLNELRLTLATSRENENKRILEDSKRNWTSEGLSLFGEILRTNQDNIEELAFKVISNLVRHLKANQGGFFLLEEDGEGKKHFRMTACYAYDRKKFADKIIPWGEGLIGACALEKETVYMRDIPDGYLSITSGLGKANPHNLIIVPLMVNEQVLGVIEIASFKVFEDFQVEFAKKTAGSIAMTLYNIQENIKTARLLRETRAQAEQLAAHEDRLRQNIEMLKTTQEQAALQAEEFISFTSSVNHTMIRADYTRDGYLIYANTRFLKKMGYSGNIEVEGKHISMFINPKDQQWFNEIWDNLSHGGKHFEGYMKHITRQGQDLWTMATYTSIRADDGTVKKILFLAIDTTEHKKQSLDFEGQISAINQLNLKSEFAPDGKFLSANALFINTLRYSENELIQKSIFDFFDKKDVEGFNDIWENVVLGHPYQGQVKLLSKNDEVKWFRISVASVTDMYNEVTKVVFIATEITNEKIMETETRRQTEKLKQQEENLRLATMELSRKFEEKNAEWEKELDTKENERSIIYDILYQQENISFTVNNLGILFFISRSAEKYWNLRSRNIIGKPALDVFSSVLNMPEPLISLMDPARSKDLSAVTCKVPDSKNILNTFRIRFLSTEMTGNIYYTAELHPVI